MVALTEQSTPVAVLINRVALMLLADTGVVITRGPAA
jgi:hypothetical protein